MLGNRRFAGALQAAGELEDLSRRQREVLCGASRDNRTSGCAGNFGDLRALWRTRTADPLLTMEVLYQLS